MSFGLSLTGESHATAVPFNWQGCPTVWLDKIPSIPLAKELAELSEAPSILQD